MVVVIEDDESYRSAVQRLLKSAGFFVQSFASAEDFLSSGRQYETGCLIADIRMPGMSGLDLQSKLNSDRCLIPTIFITAHGDEKMRLQAMRGGAVKFLAKPFDGEILLEAVRVALEGWGLIQIAGAVLGEVFVGSLEKLRSGEQDEREHQFDHIVGSSPALESVLAEVERVAPTDSTVLVLGETGTGKELIARAIHNLSARCGRPFVKLNCAAIPFDLLESELFGHEKGAFTGAVAQKMGRFEMADTGTLFLDEIGDLPLALQPKLLRVLQEQELERLGSGRTHHINVRLVAATHRDLAQMVARNEFRRDLYYRLNVFPVLVPPLRERQEDIRELVMHFVEFARRMGKHIEQIPQTTMNAFVAYPWPGNVRELQNLIERAVIRSDHGVLPNPLPTPQGNTIPAIASQGTLRDHEAALILQTLRAAGGMIGGPRGAAARLGLKRTTLLSKMKRLGIYRPRYQRLIDEVNEGPELAFWVPFGALLGALARPLAKSIVPALDTYNDQLVPCAD
jgi:formate hydrogenlyase transcriptional activator